MSTDRVAVVEENLDRCLAEVEPSASRLGPDEPLHASTSLTAATALAILEDQLRSRAVDVAARELRSRGEGFYTISSAGHENNAVLGALLRRDDPCFLHYRSGALMMARSRHDPDADPVRDTLLSIVASSEDPISGGRHKVWGSRSLWVPPQTSTIASHLPKAVGAAFAIERTGRLGLATDVSRDAVVLCSFGDASANHATALAGVNAARYSHRRGSPAPIVFLCEDNALGISVDTPKRWIEGSFSALPHLRYVRADGELDSIWDSVREAIDWCRDARAPVFIHLDTVRLWGHAGSDVEIGYRSLEEIERDEARDPLLANVRLLTRTGAATPQQLRDIVAQVRSHVREVADEVVSRPKLTDRAQVTAPLASYDAEGARSQATRRVDDEARVRHFGRQLPEDATPAVRRTMAAHINSALHDEMLRRDEMVVFGEDVGRKGGVYHLTADLQQRFGIDRVFDTLLDETTILGVAQGAGLMGLLPVPEIQYLAYVHNALDQIRGEAASTAFFSEGRFTNPMVVRIASFAYQRGFGGHFHNDDSIGALRDIPGLILAAPSRGDDAAMMLRGCLATAEVSGRVVCFLEPIALYHERDLYEDDDGGWLSDYPPPGTALLPGEVGVHDARSPHVLIVTYANGVRMSLRAARRLAEDGIRVRVLDLRWLKPLPHGEVRRHADDVGRVLVADECRETGGGIADAVIADLVESGYRGHVASVRSADSFVPLGPAASTVLISEEQIETAARDLARRRRRPRRRRTARS